MLLQFNVFRMLMDRLNVPLQFPSRVMTGHDSYYQNISHVDGTIENLYLKTLLIFLMKELLLQFVRGYVPQ